MSDLLSRSGPAGWLRTRSRCGRRRPAAAVRRTVRRAVRRLCLEWTVRLPGHGRTGRPVSNVVDLPFVV